MTHRSDSMVSMPSPAAITSSATPKRTALPRRWPIARRGVSIGALSRPDGSSQVRCTPVILPARSVTAAISAGQVSVGTVGIGAVIAAWMKAERTGSVQSRNAACAQIGFGDRAQDRLRHGEKPPCRFRRSGRRGVRSGAQAGSGSGRRQARKAPRLVERRRGGDQGHDCGR